MKTISQCNEGYHDMPKASVTPKEQAFRKAAGADLRAMREKLGASQSEVAEVFKYNKDAIAKMELGVNTLFLQQYLELLIFYESSGVADLNHPALALARRYGLKS